MTEKKGGIKEKTCHQNLSNAGFNRAINKKFLANSPEFGASETVVLN